MAKGSSLSSFFDPCLLISPPKASYLGLGPLRGASRSSTYLPPCHLGQEATQTWLNKNHQGKLETEAPAVSAAQRSNSSGNFRLVIGQGQPTGERVTYSSHAC